MMPFRRSMVAAVATFGYAADSSKVLFQVEENQFYREAATEHGATLGNPAAAQIKRPRLAGQSTLPDQGPEKADQVVVNECTEEFELVGVFGEFNHIPVVIDWSQIVTKFHTVETPILVFN